MKANIVVIDNGESIRFGFQRFFPTEGHNVITAKGYLEALARIDETESGLIFADIFLRDRAGIDILWEGMQRSRKTRVMIMTAYLSKEAAQDSYHIHAVGYLVKPMKQRGLLDSANMALQ